LDYGGVVAFKRETESSG